jgi:hypothetical protein
MEDVKISATATCAACKGTGRLMHDQWVQVFDDLATEAIRIAVHENRPVACWEAKFVDEWWRKRGFQPCDYVMVYTDCPDCQGKGRRPVELEAGEVFKLGMAAFVRHSDS